MWKQKNLFSLCVLSRTKLNANFARLFHFFISWHFVSFRLKIAFYFIFPYGTKKKAKRIMKLMWGSRLEIDSVHCKYFYWCIIMESLTLCWMEKLKKYLRFRFAMFISDFFDLRINKMSEIGVILFWSFFDSASLQIQHFSHILGVTTADDRRLELKKSCFWKMQIGLKMVHWHRGSTAPVWLDFSSTILQAFGLSSWKNPSTFWLSMQNRPKKIAVRFRGRNRKHFINKNSINIQIFRL